jgi:hypothetical protein
MPIPSLRFTQTQQENTQKNGDIQRKGLDHRSGYPPLRRHRQERERLGWAGSSACRWRG